MLQRVMPSSSCAPLMSTDLGVACVCTGAVRTGCGAHWVREPRVLVHALNLPIAANAAISQISKLYSLLLVFGDVVKCQSIASPNRFRCLEQRVSEILCCLHAICTDSVLLTIERLKASMVRAELTTHQCQNACGKETLQKQPLCVYAGVRGIPGHHGVEGTILFRAAELLHRQHIFDDQAVDA